MITSYQKKLAKLMMHPAWNALVIFIFFCCLYISTASPTNVGYADSDLMITIGYQLGVAHPPGYPLYMLLIYGITHLPIPGTIAFRAHVLSAILQSASLAFIFLACHRLIDTLNPVAITSKTKQSQSTLLHIPHSIFNIFVPYFSTLVLGTSFLYWLYGSVAEKYPLNDLFIAITVYLLISITTTKSRLSLKSMFLAIAVGLALTYHSSYLMLLPAISLAIFFNRHQLMLKWKLLLFTFLLSLIAPIILLLPLNTHQVPISWHFEPTITGLYRELTRRDFTGYLLIQDRYRGIYLNPQTWQEILTKVPIYVQHLLNHFGIVSFALIIIGSLGLFKTILVRVSHLLISKSNDHRFIDESMMKKIQITLIVWVVFLCTTLFIPLYIDWFPDLSIQSLRIRMYLTGYVVIPLIIAFAIYQLVSFIRSFYKTSYQKLLLFISFVLFVSVIYRVIILYPQLNLSRFDLVSAHYTSILQELPPDSLLACLSDTSCFALLYAQQINGVRPDIIILPHGKPVVRDYLAQFPNLHGFDYPDNPQQFLDYLTWNLDKRPVYIVDLQQIYSNLLGLNYGFLYYIPHGYYGQLVTQLPSDLASPDYSFSRQLVDTDFPQFDQTRLQLKASAAQKHLLNATIYQRLQSNYKEIDSTQIDTEIKLAQQLAAHLPLLYQQQVTAVQQSLTSITGFAQYVPGIDQPTQDQILTQAQLYSQHNQPALAALGCNSILYKNPLDHQTRLELAQLYLQFGDRALATQELHNILKYDPENQAVSELLSAIMLKSDDRQ
jgi:hypothetical protein